MPAFTTFLVLTSQMNILPILLIAPTMFAAVLGDTLVDCAVAVARRAAFAVSVGLVPAEGD